jgi:hypothetical protein
MFSIPNLTKLMKSIMDERKKRIRPSKQEKAQARQAQRPQRVESETRFDDLLKNLRAPEPRPVKQNTPTTVKRGEGRVLTKQAEREDLDAAEKPTRKLSGKSSDPNYCRMTLYLSRAVHRAFKTKSTALDLELSEVLERLILQWLAIDEIDDPFLKHFSVPRDEKK